MPRPLRVFLCHASQDKPAVRELYNALKSEGWIDPWLDKAKILPGQDWEMVIEKAVDDSDVVIICLSNQSVSKDGFVQREISYAYDLALEKPEETIFLIPLRLDDCNVPRKLRTIHWVDYFGAEKQNAYANVLEALQLRYDQKTESEAAELEREAAEKERIAREKTERERKAKAERERLAAQQAEDERKAREKAEAERKAKAERKKIQNSEFRILNLKPLPIVGIALVAFVLFFIGKAVFDNLPETPAPDVTATATAQVTVTSPVEVAPEFSIGSTQVSEEDGMTMLFVPAGEFTMGVGSDAHKVTLDSFWIDQTEVTNAMYAKCVADGTCKEPTDKSSYTHPNYYGNSEFDDYPVIYVDWNMAKAYCAWAGRSLPTEAQWEKAAHGTDGRTYPWGNDAPNKDLLNYNSNIGDTTKVGSYESGKSPYGLYDMAGNVWEWVFDWYSDTYYQNSPASNPLGSDTGTYRVLRGGAWVNDDNDVRSAIRSRLNPTNTNYIIGFRCARSHP